MTGRSVEFAEYYAARYQVLRRTAYLLSGSWHDAEDLTGKIGKASPGGTRERLCEMDLGYTVFPPRTIDEGSFQLPVSGGSETLTAWSERWDRLPANYNTPCRNDAITEWVGCTTEQLPDGSTLQVSDFYDVQVTGNPPHTNTDKVAARMAARRFPDGRMVEPRPAPRDPHQPGGDQLLPESLTAVGRTHALGHARNGHGPVACGQCVIRAERERFGAGECAPIAPWVRTRLPMLIGRRSACKSFVG